MSAPNEQHNHKTYCLNKLFGFIAFCVPIR